jgi:hypothetical protein
MKLQLLVSLLLALVFTTASDSAAQTGPVAAYGFEEGSGSAVTDASGNGNTGAITNAARTTTGRFGSALVFDGTTSVVRIPDSPFLDLTTAMTIEAWVFPSTSARVPALLKESGNGSVYALNTADNGNRPSARVTTASNDRNVSGNNVLPLNTWSHLAATYSGSILRLFVNGVEVDAENVGGTISVSTGAFAIGANVARREFFNGRLDEVRVYNRALTAAEIRVDMVTPVATAPPPPPPVDVIPPVVAITAPATASILSDTVTVTAAASDNVGVVAVQFAVDGVALGGEDLTPPYTASWNTTTASNGPHVLTASARDAEGNRTTSAAIAVTVDNDLIAPGVAITSPPAGGSVSDTLTITASASDNVAVVGVQFLLDGALLGAEDLVAPYAVTWDTTTATNGAHVIIAIARDGEGNRTTSAAITVTVDNDLTAPTVSISSPTAGATVSNTATLIASASDNVAVVGVQFLLDGAPLGTEDLVAPHAATWDTTTATNGAHTITATARDAKGNRATSAPVTVTVSNDRTAPAIAVTAPAAGATVNATVTVTAAATDNVGVAGVQFLLDGSPLGAENLTAPFTATWNTNTAANGAHSLAATARDAAGNIQTSAAIVVTVANVTDPTGPALVGSWQGPLVWPLVAVHMTLLHTGDVLAWDDHGTSSMLWNPASNTFSDLPNTAADLFCASQSQLADGRILVAGGHNSSLLGSRATVIYDPVTRRYTTAAQMAFARWYPTTTTLGDGRVLVIGGAQTCFTCIAEVPEIYDPAANTWTPLNGARINLPLYPYDYLLPDGRIVTTGANEGITVTRALNLATQTWSVVDPIAVDGGSSAMYRPGKIIKSGSWSRNTDLPSVPTSPTTYVIDMNSATPTWRQTAPMAFPRAHHNLTILPDGSVIVTGGERMSDGIDVTQAVFEAELWSPATESWQTLAPMTVPRLYHGSALLMPDARVLVAGSGGLSGARDQLSAEIYSPPYLFKGARPTITAAPDRVDYGRAFDILTPDAASIASVSLIRPGTVTHTFDTGQRYIELTFRQSAGGITIDAPENANLAPPGYYMLFVVNANGVPSVAAFVHLALPAGDTEPPSAPASVAAAGGLGTAALTWTAATDNTAVSAYNVHRSTTSGFPPALANRIAQVTTTSFVDTGAAAGTYFYVVTAQDVVGNVSAPSNEAVADVTADVTPPTVSLTSPAAGATISGTVTVTASASDDVSVAGVQLRVNGVNTGAEDTSAPYAIAWNSASVANSPYTLTVVARDGAGNVTESADVLVTVSNAQTATGLVAAYNFDEAAGPTIADRSGNGHTGTIAGATWVAGRTGGALSFDGVNDWVTVNDAPALSLTTAMTLEAWVMPSTVVDWQTVILKESSAGLAYSLYSSNLSGTASGYARIGGADRDATAPTRLPVNVWSHLAATYDGTALRLYVNGALVATRAITGAVTTSALPLRFGGNASWGEFFNGGIDDIRIYNRALSQSEVQNDMIVSVP